MEDGYEDYDDDNHSCWDHEAIDLLEGRACCYVCGSTRWLTSEQLRRELAIQAELDAVTEPPA